MYRLFLIFGLLLALALPAHAQSSADSRILRVGAFRVIPSGGIEEDAFHRIRGLEIGEEIDLIRLGVLRSRLYESGEFEAIELYTERGDAPGQLTVVAELKRRGGVRVVTGFGHHPIEGWYLDLIGLRWGDPLGPEGGFRMGWRSGWRSSDVYAEGSSADRLPFGGSLLYGFSSGVEVWPLWDGIQNYQIGVERGKIELGGRWYRGEDFEFEFALGRATRRPRGTAEALGDFPDRPDSSFGLPPRIRQDSSTLRLRFSQSTTKDQRSWREGQWLWAEWLGRRPDRDAMGQRSNKAYLKTQAEFRHAEALGEGQAIAIRARLGRIATRAPFHEKLVVEGIDGWRGAQPGRLGGVGGVEGEALLSAEYRHALHPRGVERARFVGVLFADALHLQSGSEDAQALAAGFGLRIRIPWVRWIRVDAGFPIAGDYDAQEMQLHLGLGSGF